MTDPIKITVYRWAGKWGPFKVKIPCGECALTHDIIENVCAINLPDVPVHVETYDWLSNWWKPLLKGGWHAPIVLVEDRLISQGVALNRGVLIEAIITEYAKRTSLQGNIVFGKEKCTYCRMAKELLDEKNISYEYRNVVTSEKHLYEMLARVKPIVGPKTPITTPQIWLEGEYVGGYEELSEKIE